MSYWKRWRKFRLEATALVLSDSGSEDDVHELTNTISEEINEATIENACPESNDSLCSNEAYVSDHRSVSVESSSEESDFGFTDTVESSDTSDSDPESQQTVKGKLASWSARHNLTKSSVDELLGMLREEGLSLPKDGRTLLQTPRSVDSEDKCGGKYIYYGLENGLVKVLGHLSAVTLSKLETIKLNVNIDGVPLFKSSGKQFWPILCSFGGYEPFIVALFFGDAKPNSLNDYLSDFLNELSLVVRLGVSCDSKTFQVGIQAFICDAPARAFIKSIKGHTGYYACERCVVKGQWKNNRVMLHSSETCPPRTDDDFARGIYQDHQNGISPLVYFGISCVKSFCLDYMHLVCLGVVKRMLWFWKQGPPVCKLSQRQLGLISENLSAFSGKLPSEFARQPRTLHELERWKATEYRQFLLYTGPIVLRKVLSHDFYAHFLTLMVAISILLESDDQKRTSYLDYAQHLLSYFVHKSKELYSERFIVYNIHNLSHITDDVRHFGCSLNEISAFPYENHLQTIKRLVRNGRNPIAQVTKRLKERELSKVTSYRSKSTSFNNMHISTASKNQCFLLKNEALAFVKEKREDGTFVCDIIPHERTLNFFTEPCESKLINILYIPNRCVHRSRRQLEKRELYKKCVCLTYGDGKVIVAWS